MSELFRDFTTRGTGDCSLHGVGFAEPPVEITNSVYTMSPFAAIPGAYVTTSVLFKAREYAPQTRQLGSRWRARCASVSGCFFCPVLKAYTHLSYLVSLSRSLCEFSRILKR